MTALDDARTAHFALMRLGCAGHEGAPPAIEIINGWCLQHAAAALGCDTPLLPDKEDHTMTDHRLAADLARIRSRDQAQERRTNRERRRYTPIDNYEPTDRLTRAAANRRLQRRLMAGHRLGADRVTLARGGYGRNPTYCGPSRIPMATAGYAPNRT